LFSGDEGVLVPSEALNGIRAGELEVIGGHLPSRIPHVDVDMHVWIGPFDLRHDAGRGDDLVVVVLSLETVMGSGRRDQADEPEHREQDRELRSHHRASYFFSSFRTWPPSMPIWRSSL